ncbi:hypothetical protein ACJZ2D_015886 [Fusarium nematophilum]
MKQQEYVLNLEDCPAEIICLIVAPLRASQLDGLSRASNRLRRILIKNQSMFYAVKFDGEQSTVLESLRLFVHDRPGSHMAELWQSIRLYYWEHDNCDARDGVKNAAAIKAYQSSMEYPELPRHIVEAIERVPQLSTLSLDIYHLSAKQRDNLKLCLQVSPKWPTVNDVGIQAEWSVYGAIFSQCLQEKVISVRLPRWNGLRYAAARDHLPGIKRLHLESQGGGSGACWPRFIDTYGTFSACDDFRRLEWLIVSQALMPEAPGGYHCRLLAANRHRCQEGVKDHPSRGLIDLTRPVKVLEVENWPAAR